MNKKKLRQKWQKKYDQVVANENPKTSHQTRQKSTSKLDLWSFSKEKQNGRPKLSIFFKKKIVFFLMVLTPYEQNLIIFFQNFQNFQMTGSS